MSRSREIVALAVVVLLLVGAGTVFASETKHSAMAGSQLIPTNAELNAFAWKAIDAGTFFEVTSGVNQYDGVRIPGASEGHAQMVIQITEDLALQFQSNKNSFGTRVASYAWYGTVSRAPFHYRSVGNDEVSLGGFRGKPSHYNAIMQGQRFDVDLAGRMGDGGWSIGLSQAGAGETDNVADTQDTDSFLGVRGSWGNGKNIDAAFEAGYEKATLDTGSDKLEGSTMLLTGLGTYQISDWILRGAVHLEAGSHDESAGSEIVELDHAMFALLGGVGRLLKDDDSGQLSVEGYLDLSGTGQDDVEGDDAKTGHGSVAIPGMRVGFWHKIGGPFKVMGGAAAEYRGNATVQDDSSGERVVEEGVAGLNFFWTLGSSVTLAKKVDIDVQIHPEAIPNLLSLGNSDPVVMVASVNVAI